EVRQGLPMYSAAEALRPDLGKVNVPGSIVRATVQALIDRSLGHRSVDLADRLSRYDQDRMSRMDAAQRRNVAQQVVDLSRNAESVARAVEERLSGTRSAAAGASAPAAAGHRAAVSAARDAMTDVNERHTGRFNVSKERYDNGTLAEIVYEHDQRGRKYDVRLRFTFGPVEDGRAVVPVPRRSRLGRFDFLVNVDADPVRIRQTLARIADNIRYDREHKVPLRRRLYADVLPTAARAARAGGVGLVSGSIAAGAVAGIGAGMHAVGRYLTRL